MLAARGSVKLAVNHFSVISTMPPKIALESRGSDSSDPNLSLQRRSCARGESGFHQTQLTDPALRA